MCVCGGWWWSGGGGGGIAGTVPGNAQEITHMEKFMLQI